jgi:tRNA uridine 5-carboxymethylaminomethyl modification enzyme
VQGLFTGMPEDVQLAALRTMPALRDAEIMRPGYAIEYDAITGGQFDGGLASKRVEGLYHAGQINGTSGYEEAAAQGLIAGINAAQHVRGGDPLLLRRDEAYIGVMIDDLATKAHREPYRVMTSRAEYRLLLRQDNADLRLTSLGYELGLVPYERHRAVEEKRSEIERELARLETTWLPPSAAVNAAFREAGLGEIDDGVNALSLLRRPGAAYALIKAVAPLDEPLSPLAAAQVEVEAKYAGYIARQRAEVERMARLENRRIPRGFDYQAVLGLRNEAREQLTRYHPLTVGQAARLAGVNPADVVIVMAHLNRGAPDVAGA